MAPVDPEPQHHLQSRTDFYELLGIASTFTDAKELRTAYRKASVRFHPDKVTTQNSTDAEREAARDRWDLFEVGRKVLEDPALREQYDNFRKAREANRIRDEALSAEQRRLKDDLLTRESKAGSGFRGQGRQLSDLEREERRLAAEGMRMRMELTDKRRREAQAERDYRLAKARRSRGNDVKEAADATSSNGPKRTPYGGREALSELMSTTIARLQERARTQEQTTVPG